MDYATFAIALWIVFSVIVGIVSRRSMSKLFGMPQNKYVKIEWKGYLFCCMILGAVPAIGITFLIESLS